MSARSHNPASRRKAALLLPGGAPDGARALELTARNMAESQPMPYSRHLFRGVAVTQTGISWPSNRRRRFKGSRRSRRIACYDEAGQKTQGRLRRYRNRTGDSLMAFFHGAERRPMLLSAGGVILLLLTTACGGSKTDDQAADESERGGRSAVPVMTAALELASFTDTTRVFGSLAPLHTVTITAETTGRIEYLPVDDGSRVKKGQTLARINARVTSAQLKQARAAYDMQKVETDRTRALVEKKIAPPQQLDLAQAQLKQAEAAVELIEANLAKAVIRAPISGIVVMTNADQGEVASMGLPLMTIVDISSVVVAADVPERDIALMKTGEAVPVTIEAFPDRTFPGLIGYIDYVANPTTRTFLMKIGIDNENEMLRPGMLASVDLERRTYQDVVVAPRDAVIDDVEGQFVYVVDGGVARRRAVTLGPTRGPFAVVSEGLKPDERLLVAGHRQVVDGQKIAESDAGACCKQQLLAPSLAKLDLGISQDVLEKAMAGGPEAIKAALEEAKKNKAVKSETVVTKTEN